MRPFSRRSLAAVAAAAMAVATFAQVIFSALASELLEEFDADRWQVGRQAVSAPAQGTIADCCGSQPIAERPIQWLIICRWHLVPQVFSTCWRRAGAHSKSPDRQSDPG